ncbi:alpha-(1,3)-fucosyltransferase 7-like [Engraulis encrasicolus]|uniref:alpha-(1,3)-fucosyltransferase 7-like n=1 Tax=Engraulis encrasicolus TaxID=184585 RepID=UPI002FCF783D
MADRWTILAVPLVCLTLLGSLLVHWPTLLNTFQRPKPLSNPRPKLKSTISFNIANMPTIESTIPVNVTTTTVLIWYWAFGFNQGISPNVCKERFGIPNCMLSDDRSLFPKADFIIFHNRELITGQQRLPLQLPRPPNQGWVWFSIESPPHNGNLRPFAGMFNYTMSYRRDADFFMPYGWLAPRLVGPGMTVEDFIPKEKSHLACWIVSNYADHHRRTQVYNRLKQVINVEVYGGGAVNGRRVASEDLLPTISHCYFYLAFENSEFQDYITEKLWKNAFIGGAVPVVLGPPRKNYEAMIPKDSFIHVDDFESEEELGQFLKQLAGDRERYTSYFKWKLNYTVTQTSNWLVEPECRICTKLTTLQRPKVYRDLQSWEWK